MDNLIPYKDNAVTIPEGDKKEIVLVQPRLDGEKPEPVKETPQIEWEKIPEKIKRFGIWGRDIIDQIKFCAKRYENFQPLSWRDAEQNYKQIKKQTKFAEQIKKGWNEQLQSFVSWKEFVPHEHVQALGELCGIASERILELNKAVDKLWIHERRMEAFVNGRW